MFGLSSETNLIPSVICIFSFCKRANQKHIEHPGNKIQVKQKVIFSPKLGLLKQLDRDSVEWKYKWNKIS